MRNFTLTCAILCLFVQATSAQPTDTQEPPPLLRMGAGLLATFAQQNEFPTGASVRVWILGQFGLEADVFTRESNPTFAIRTLYRFIDGGIVSLYLAGGVAFFSSGLSFDSTLQGALGLAIDVVPQLVFSAEVGLLLGGNAPVPVTAAVGIHYYF